MAARKPVDESQEQDYEAFQMDEGVLSKEEIALLRRAETPTVAWRPQAGQSIVGTFLDSKVSAEGKYGSYPIVELECHGKAVLIHAFHTMLRTEFEDRDLTPGDLVAIHYYGEEDGAKGTLHRYRVTINRKSPASVVTPKMGQQSFEEEPF